MHTQRIQFTDGFSGDFGITPDGRLLWNGSPVEITVSGMPETTGDRTCTVTDIAVTLGFGSTNRSILHDREVEHVSMPLISRSSSPATLIAKRAFFNLGDTVNLYLRKVGTLIVFPPVRYDRDHLPRVRDYIRYIVPEGREGSRLLDEERGDAFFPYEDRDPRFGPVRDADSNVVLTRVFSSDLGDLVTP